MQSYYEDQNMNTNKLQISSDFISLYFHEKIPLLVFMSEIKINLTPEKNQIFCFFHA